MLLVRFGLNLATKLQRMSLIWLRLFFHYIDIIHIFYIFYIPVIRVGPRVLIGTQCNPATWESCINAVSRLFREFMLLLPEGMI